MGRMKSEHQPRKLISPLSSVDREKLREFETIVEHGWAAFVRVGKALSEIEAKRLYREEFPSYCQKRWDIGRAHAYRLIGAAETIDQLSQNSDKLPNHEFQVRLKRGVSSLRSATEKR